MSVIDFITTTVKARNIGGSSSLVMIRWISLYLVIVRGGDHLVLVKIPEHIGQDAFVLSARKMLLTRPHTESRVLWVSLYGKLVATTLAQPQTVDDIVRHSLVLWLG